MSRIGKKPVAVPSGVTLTVDGQVVKAKGAKGELTFTAPKEVTIEMGEDGVKVMPVDLSKTSRSMWGMSRSMIENLCLGVSEGWKRNLELVGVGYRAQMKGKSLNLQLGYSHDIDFEPPAGVDIQTPKPTEIEITGMDKQAVGETAAKIRSFRPPEPYKGKGVKYAGEFIFRKEGKKK